MSEMRKPVWRRGVKFVRSRRSSLAVLPTMLTLGNGTCGLAAIAVAVSDTLLWPEEQKLMVAGLLIFGGMLFDAFDGAVARMTKQSTDFGAQLDSLCDAITFGTAPAVIVWRYSEVLPHRLAWTIGVLFALCVLLRLARFNAETKEDDPHEGFDGLPSPAAAGTIASFAIAVPHFTTLQAPEYALWIQQWAKFGLQASHYLMPFLAVVLAYLMVSRFRYPHVFQSLLSGRRTTHQIGHAIFACVGLVLLHELILPMGLCYYAFAPPIRKMIGNRWSPVVRPTNAKAVGQSTDEDAGEDDAIAPHETARPHDLPPNNRHQKATGQVKKMIRSHPKPLKK